MKQLGDEKKLKELFSELKVTDELNVPSFAQTIARTGIEKTSAFRFSYAFAMVLFALFLVSTIWFFQTEKQADLAKETVAPEQKTMVEENQNTLLNQPPNRKILVENDKPKTKLVLIKPPKTLLQPIVFRVEKNLPKKKNAKSVQLLAKELMLWKSPTESLLQTPVQALLKPVRLGLPNKNKNEEKNNEN